MVGFDILSISSIATVAGPLIGRLPLSHDRTVASPETRNASANSRWFMPRARRAALISRGLTLRHTP